MADSKAEVKKTEKKKNSFWKGLRQEWDKIIWTPWSTVGKETGVVIVVSIIMGIMITVVDSASIRLIERILGF
jgi:preprotein translocase subunit SecE